MAFDLPPLEGSPAKPPTAPTPPENAPSTTQYSGFWRRVAASLIDNFITDAIAIIGGLLLGAVFILLPSSEAADAIGSLVGGSTMLIIGWLYYAISQSSGWQATPGKLALGIKVTDSEGNRITFGRATGRVFATILSALPFGIGFLFPLWTRKKQALHDFVVKTVVIREGRTYFLRVMFVTVTAITVIFVSAGWLSYKLLLPKIQQYFSTMWTVGTHPGEISDIGLRPEQIAEESGVILDPDSSELEVIFGESLDPDVASGPSAHLGPVIVEYDTYWKDEEDPRFWISVKTIPIPNLDLGGQHGALAITSVQDVSGNELHNTQHTLEENDTHWHFDFDRLEHPTPHLRGLRTVHLIPGTVEEDIARISGTLTLKIPIAIETMRFTKAEGEKTGEEMGMAITVRSIEGSQVAGYFKGVGEPFVTFRAYNAEEQELEHQLLYNFGGTQEWDTRFTNLYKGEVDSVEALYAKELVERSFPFVINVKNPAASDDPLAKEYDMLALLTNLPTDSSYEVLRLLLPTIGELSSDAGDNNTEARITMALFGTLMNGEFNFHDGKLVSHGFLAGGLTEEVARDMYTKAKEYLIQHHGYAEEQEGPLEDGHDGYSWSTNWVLIEGPQPGTTFGVFMEKTYDGYHIGWGAQ